MNKYELAKKITQLEGLTNEEKASLVELLRSQKKYGLVWEDKPEETETRLVDELPVLTEVTERAIVSDSPDAPNHILIEGDNLEALTALAYTHEGKIDVIYIDPPYNTGNKDFVYNDSFVDKEDGYRHSKWLSFMNKRLQIAKSLLSSGGVIFISIDDNEQAQLKMLCDEIFGAKNFVASLPRITKSSGKTTDKIATNNDLLFVYSKDIDQSIIEGLPHNDEGFKYTDNYFLERGKYKLNQTLDYDSLSYSESLDYPIEIGGHILYPGNNYDKYIERKKGNHKRADWAWRWSKELYKFGVDQGFVVLKKGRNGYRIYTKTYQNAKIVRNGDEYKVEISQRKKPLESLEFIQNIYSNDNAKKELGLIFEDLPFDYPKPTQIMNTLLKVVPAKTVLDFFAGSGTTLHATMQLNAEDGGHRKCILVTNNENGICENVTYERNKRVIQGYTTPKGEDIEGLHDNNLRYYRTTLLSRDKSVKNMRQLVHLATDMLCIKNDVYTEAEFCGKHLNPNIARYFDNGQGNRMLVIYEERAIQLLVQLMAQTEDDGIKTMVYVFSPGADPYTDDFEDVAERVKLCALPSAIYEAYKRVLPKRKPKFLDEALQEMKAQAEAGANAQQTLDFGENDNMNEKGGEA